jgi:AcrR family transcriptional regulator
MGRPPAHSADEFVDAAVRLFAAGGARAVTMTSVARELGVHSGSIYHRFPGRPALLAAVWLRTERRFHQRVLRVVEDRLDAEGVAHASGWIVDWSRDNAEEAAVLHAGVRAFSPDTWPEQARAELAEITATRDRETARVVRALRKRTGRDAEVILLALVDLPISVVSRYLARGTVPPESATELARRVARLVMSD